MYLFVRPKQIAIHLLSGSLDGGRNVQEGKTLRCGISLLTDQSAEVDGADIQTGRGAGLHPLGGNSQRSELIGNSVRSFLADATSFEAMLPDVHAAVQERPGGQNNGLRVENGPCNCTNGGDFSILKQKIRRKIRVNA